MVMESDEFGTLLQVNLNNIVDCVSSPEETMKNIVSTSPFNIYSFFNPVFECIKKTRDRN